MNIHSASYVAAIFIAIVISNNVGFTECVIGINWGRQNAQRLIPSVVVDLLLQNRVPSARVYTSQVDLMRAFVGSGIDLTITISDIKSVGTYEKAQSWVQEKSPWLVPSNVKRIFIGTQMFAGSIADKRRQTQIVNALNFTQMALNEAGYSQVKATIPHPFHVLNMNLTRPSDADLRESVREQFLRYLGIIKASGAPACFEIFPVDLMIVFNISDISFAYPDGRSSHSITDVGGTTYTDVFQFAYDSFAWALDKAGAHDVEIVISQIGWPTDGFPNSNAAAAEHFFRALLPFVASSRGTRRRPGKPIEVYVHALTDENRLPASIPFSRHWGIYRSNGEPKYRIDLTGQGRDIFPARARGIQQMPRRWCVMDRRLSEDDERLATGYTLACKRGDCTSMYDGGSCSKLNRWQNVSYAFNMYFQALFQDEEACKFGGLGEVVTVDPSVEGCVFPVEVVRGLQDNYKSPGGEGCRVHHLPGFAGVAVLLASTLWALFYS